MPTLDAVTVRVSGAASAAVSPARLTFTPADWMQPQALTVTKGGDGAAVRFTIEKLALDATVRLDELGGAGGTKLPFRTIP